MKFFINLKKIQPVILACFMALGLMGAFSFLNSPVASAQQTRPQALEMCNTRIQKAQCITAVNACQPQNTARCLTVAMGRFDPVNQYCRDNSNPQACHQRVVDTCRSVPAAEREALEACRQRAADGTTSRSSTTITQTNPSGSPIDFNAPEPGANLDKCGSGPNAIETRFNFGCTGQGNPIVDIAFAIIRFLSYGVGLILAASIIYAGIQYSTSGGNPEATIAAKKRILNTLIALIFYLLIFAFIQYLVPGGLFN